MDEAEVPGRPEQGPLPSEKIIALRDALEESRLPYAFGGAVALFYYRDPRSTTDIDLNLFLPPERREEAETVLSGVYPLDVQQFDSEVGRSGQVRSLWGATYIDLFFADTDFHDSMAKRVRRFPFLDTEINVLSAEDLLICKTLFDRPKDWLDIEAVGISQQGKLDVGYINDWLGQFLPDDDPRLGRIREALG
jgi:hypothetical protein